MNMGWNNIDLEIFVSLRYAVEIVQSIAELVSFSS